MEKSVPQTPTELELNATGLAIECGTLPVLVEALHLQYVLIMPISRVVQRNSLAIQQFAIHITARPHMSAPVYYATIRAAEISKTLTGTLLTAPYPLREQQSRTSLLDEALRLQRELQICVTHLLTNDVHVSSIVAPARYRLPDTWVWQADATDPRIVCVDRAWKLLEEVLRG